MACTLSTLLTEAAANGYPDLQSKEQKIAALQLFYQDPNSGSTTAQINTLLAAAASNGYFCLDYRHLKAAILQLLISGEGSAATSQTLITAGTATGFTKLEHKALKEAILQLLCDLGSGSMIGNVSDLAISGTSTHTSVVLTWTNAHPPTNYEVWRSTDGGVTFSLYTTINGSLTTWTDPTAMTSGQIFIYKLRSVGLVTYSNTAVATYLAFGGALLVKRLNTGIFTYTNYTATANDDGSATLGGGGYGAPSAGSRGATLNSAINDFNIYTGTTIAQDLWISAGVFDVGGAWPVNPSRWFWMESLNSLMPNMGSIYGQGTALNPALTQIELSCPTSGWRFFSALALGNVGIFTPYIANLKLNAYYDGPDMFIVTEDNHDGSNYVLFNTIIDNTRCRKTSDSTVLKSGWQATDCTVTGASARMFTTGLADKPFNATLVNTTCYFGGYCFWSDQSSTLTAYNSTFNKKYDGVDYDFIMQTGGSAGPTNVTFYKSVDDGGGIDGVTGISTNISGATAALYDHSSSQNHGPHGFDLDVEGGPISVSTTSSYTTAFGTPTPVSDPTYVIPTLPTPMYSSPIFLT